MTPEQLQQLRLFVESKEHGKAINMLVNLVRNQAIELEVLRKTMFKLQEQLAEKQIKSKRLKKTI